MIFYLHCPLIDNLWIISFVHEFIRSFIHSFVLFSFYFLMQLTSMQCTIQISDVQPKVLITGLILGLCPANERRGYFVTMSLIGWVQAENEHCYTMVEWNMVVTLSNNFDRQIGTDPSFLPHQPLRCWSHIYVKPKFGCHSVCTGSLASTVMTTTFRSHCLMLFGYHWF